MTIEALGVDALDAVDAISSRAFDPLYGEAWTKAQCLSILGLPGYRLTGAWRGPAAGAELAGFAIDRVVAGESELLLLAVDPAAHRSGIATALLQDWFHRAGAQGAGRLFLEMRRDNPARFLYEKLGFEEIAVRPAYYLGRDGVSRDAVTMVRDGLR